MTPNSRLKVASFFAGIGGFDLGLERSGMRVVFQCEINAFSQRVLKSRWPEVELHGDITQIRDHYAAFGDRLPNELATALDTLESSLN